jgi:hypothetical protein
MYRGTEGIRKENGPEEAELGVNLFGVFRAEEERDLIDALAFRAKVSA